MSTAPKPIHINSKLISYFDNELASPSTANDEQNIIPTSALQFPSNTPKNLRFKNTGQHKYNLRSTTSPNLIIYLSVDPKYQLNHLYHSDEKKETIDSLLKGNNSAT